LAAWSEVSVKEENTMPFLNLQEILECPEVTLSIILLITKRCAFWSCGTKQSFINCGTFEYWVRKVNKIDSKSFENGHR
jgi:hypothetical protein